MTLISEEIAWFEVGDATIFAALLIDSDYEYSAVIFAADLAGKYRWVSQTAFCASVDAALDLLPGTIAAIADDLERVRTQGDEREPVDFFAPAVRERSMHPLFRQLIESSGWSAARQLISVMMRWYDNQDGNYVEQFQTTAFDSRLWELYMFAVLVEAGFVVEQPAPAPDFEVERFGARLLVEATALNPSGGALVGPSTVPTEPTERAAYIGNYLPIRFARSLTAKLDRAYWDDPSWRPAPFVIAIQDFHDSYSMTFSVEALRRYLYAAGDQPDPTSGHEVIDEHVWGKIRVPSGFFSIPAAKHVSAVIFNPSGTLSKFNRMGVAAGFGMGDLLLHSGYEFEAVTETVQHFSRKVEPDYPEKWVNGLQVFHNPRAEQPLEAALLPGAAHIWFDDNRFTEMIPDGHLIASMNMILTTRSRGPGDEPQA